LNCNDSDHADNTLDLHSYFQRIFERIWADDERADERYGADTARIFKTCIAADEPLPAAIFPVLVCDSPHDMAMSTHIEKTNLGDDPVEVDIIRAKVNRRCQDLLAVVAPNQDEDRKATRLKRLSRIEFLHRSVQDFLQQCKPVSEKLDRLAGPGFSADRTLIACYIFIIKKFGLLSRRTPDWSSQALLHLSRIGDGYDMSAARMLRELDQAMQAVYGRGQEHWSNRASESGSQEDISSWVPRGQYFAMDFAEHGNRDLVGHLIELNLIHPVKEALAIKLPAKRGRPLLDYALRFDPYAAFRQCSYSMFQFPANAMVELLLSRGCNVNEPIQIYKGRTVWDLYLAFLSNRDIQASRHCKTTWLLINHGAKPIRACVMELSMKEILSSAFGEQEAEKMCERISKNEVGGGWRARLTWKLRLGL
jgi:hypothetical protein